MKPLLAAIALSPVAAFAAPVAHAGQLVGIVFDAATGAPARGIHVYTSHGTATSDARGRFVLAVPAGTHAVWIRSDDALAAVDTVAVAEGGSAELLITWSVDRGVVHVQQEAAAVQPTQTTPADGATGTARGVITSATDGAPVAGAKVFVRGAPIEAQTDAEGRFTLQLPVGTWDLAVVANAWASQRATDIVIDEDGTTDVAVSLVPAGVALEAWTIRAPKVVGGAAELMAERRDSSAVADLIGAEQMSRSGDSNAAAALRRVTGLTLVGGQYVYVRGLGERYSTTLLNGTSLPSPEPERRVVPLDMFPTAVLDSVVVQKTFSPDMPGEFGGGVVRLRTRKVPKGGLLKLALRVGGQAGTTGAAGLGYAGGTWDALGIDAGHRALPPAVRAASDDSPLEEGDLFSSSGYSADELEAFGEAMPNVWSALPRTLPPDIGVSFTWGRRYEIAGRPLGVLVGGSWRNSWDQRSWDRTFFLLGEGGELEAGNTFRFDDSTNQVRFGGMLGLDYDVSDTHHVESTTLVLRATENSARIYEGFSRDLGGDLRVNRLRWVERMLISEQLSGEHGFGPTDRLWQFDWRLDAALATRGEPDRRETRYDLDIGTGLWTLSDRPEGNQRFFSTNHDQTYTAAADLSIPVFGGGDAKEPGAITLGALASTRSRDVDTRRFRFMHKGEASRDDDVLRNGPEDVFTPDHIGPNGFQFEEITRETDNYAASQSLTAAYAMVEAPLTTQISVMAGARLERSDQRVRTFQLFNPDAVPVDAALTTADLLPAATLTWNLSDTTTVRAGYGRTVSRPEFRELSPAIFRDVVGGRQTFGNPDLDRATIDSIDARWEWFPDEGDVVSTSAFYKRFDSPIETLVVVGAQHAITYANAAAATNVGVEMELRKHLGIASPRLRDWYVAANGALIRSRVQLDPDAGIQTSNDRALQGQSPWVLNAQFGYDNPDSGLNAAILYNVSGPRIAQVGALGMPDTYEQPVHNLDVAVGASLGGGFGLRLSGRNLLDSAAVQTVASQEVLRIRQGWGASATLTWSPKRPHKG